MFDLKKPILLLSALSLSACMGGSGGGTGQPNIQAAKLASNIKKAMCDGKPAMALGLLNQAPDTPTNNLLAAVALNQGGKAITARSMLASIAREGYVEGIKLNCNGLSLNGTISAVAAEQLVDIQRTLLAHDVALTPQNTLHAGLEPLEDKAKKSGAYKGGMDMEMAQELKLNMEIKMPATANLNGTWFAHFASYFSQEKATAALEIFDKRYPSLKGATDYWQVQSQRGTVWRVGVPVEEWSDADRLCVTMRANGAYCKVFDRLQ